MSYIGKNIKRIRVVKKLSQAAFAELFDLARPSVGAYEEGRSEPKIDTIIAIANYFGLSTDALLRKELTVNELYSLDILKGEFDPTRLPPALGNGSNLEQKQEPTMPQTADSGSGIPFVSKASRLEYIVNLNNRDFQNRLPKVALPEEQGGKTRAFEHSGSEMLTDGGGLKEGDVLSCIPARKDKARLLQEGNLYVLVGAKEVLTRRLKKAGESELAFEADNPTVPDLHVSEADVLELWEVKGCWSTQLKQPSLVEHKLLLLEEDLRLLRARMDKLESS